jgi:hypothetical protein
MDIRLRLLAVRDQELAQAVEWAKSEPVSELLFLWTSYIQKPYADPYMEAMSRMAQIGMGAVMAELAKQEGK